LPKGLSVHIGLNAVDPTHYANWDGKLAACEFDAEDMQVLAKKQGFKSKLLLTQAATSAAVISELERAATKLTTGDIFFLTYSGHGGQVPDTNGDEPDKRDETWCLYDRQLVDDELFTLWSTFKPGVRVLLLSDSCHSGTAARSTAELLGFEAIVGDSTADGVLAPRFRALPEAVEREVYAEHQQLYDDVQARTTAFDSTIIPAHVLLISGCQDNQTSQDGDRNGLFTQTVRQVWSDGAFKGNYRTFWQKIQKAMPLWQSPNYFWAGAPDRLFERQHPFTV
jgi:hypothetical protein